MLLSKRGRVFHAIAIGRDGRDLMFEPIEHGISYRTATPREIQAHRARRGRTRKSTAERMRTLATSA
jgi:hypothetical protein